MRLQKLEINGFKSFASKTEIVFNPGITAIVGPNGSGKSNIADAVRWVLGEQSAKSLRGSKMEDIIFNGTEAKRSLGFCEVAVTFDNQDGMLPIDYAEVTIQRRVYRSGESEYLLNKTVCRLRDIIDLLRDTGIGKEGYSIIGQGRVDAILSEKSEDRRAVFEEAVGVVKYKSRQEEAERKLKQTEENIIRLSDIIDELELQKDPLFEQSERAREYLRVRDALKELELNAFLHQYNTTNSKVLQIDDSLAQLDEALERGRSEETSLAAEYAQRESALRTKENSHAAISRELHALRSGISDNDAQVRVLRERREQQTREQTRLQTEAAELESHILSLETVHDDGAQTDSLTRTIELESERLALAESELAAMSAEVTEKENVLEAQKNRTIEALNRMSDTRSMTSRLETMRESVQQRSAQVGEELDKLEENKRSLAGERVSALESNSMLENELAKLEKAARNISEKQASLQANLDTHQKRFQETEREMHALASRSQVLSEMKQNHEGYFQSVRLLLRDAQNDNRIGSGIVGVVAELIHVPKEYETAIEMALGASLQHLVTRTDQDAKRIIEYLRAKNYGRTTCLPLNSMQPRELNANEKASLGRVSDCFGVAADCIGYDAELEPVVRNLLGRTVIVQDMDAGIALMRQNRWAFRIATLKGDIMNPGGSMSGGSVAKKEFSLLGRERELDELKAKIAAIVNERGAAKSKLAEIQSQLALLDEEAQRLDKEKRATDISLIREKEKLDIIDKYIAENAEKELSLRKQLEALSDNLQDIDSKLTEAASLQSGLERDKETDQQNVVQIQEGLALLKRKREDISNLVTTHKVELATLAKERDAFESDVKRREHERGRLSETLAQKREEMERAIDLERSLGGQIDALLEILMHEREQESAQQQALDEIAVELEALRRAADELIGRREKLASEILDNTERRHKIQLQQNRLELELNALQKHIWEEYELTYEGALPYKREMQLTGADARITELRQQIRDLGDVHVGAITDYKNLTERLDSLVIQRDDLHKASDDLKKLIEELLNTIAIVFKDQFALINKNFSEVFASLFGGGKAELRLTDESDVLRSNIEINAQPPGKKLQLLSLLSGGERALTAIALLFAMLKLKPTPFCVLDEIEASLDEANVDTFARFLRTYSAKTQFILITHRKGSMNVSDSLYGVAMEEKGVSRLISVQLVEQAG